VNSADELFQHLVEIMTSELRLITFGRRLCLLNNLKVEAYGRGSQAANALAGPAIAALLHDATEKILRRLPLKPAYVQATLRAEANGHRRIEIFSLRFWSRWSHSELSQQWWRQHAAVLLVCSEK